jgi:hypothetical protein
MALAPIKNGPFLSPAPCMDSKQDGGVGRFLLYRARLNKTIWLFFSCISCFSWFQLLFFSRPSLALWAYHLKNPGGV